MTAPFLSVEGLTRRFGETVAVDHVDLALTRGEILALLGPSGSGKTTTLRLLAGFETPDAGRVIVDGDDVTRLAPVARHFGMVFQHYALFPHLDVGQNVAFGLESLHVRGDELTRRVAEALALVDLEKFERRRISQLSGGQQQRVALARALAPEPRVLLLDEPLSNLDPSLRERTRQEIREVIRRIGITTVFVTHEQDEAFDLGDRVAVLRAGRLEQIGTPELLYAEPATPFVARFVGRSASVPVDVIGVTDRGARVRVEGVEWDVPPARDRAAPATGPAQLLVRPEALWLVPAASGALAGTIESRRFTGTGSAYGVRTWGGAMVEVYGAAGAWTVGDRVSIVPSRRSGGGLHLYGVDA
ncbi:MAG: ABC transporter ATP-binding protein [Gemmatimonadota bacterium]